MSKKQYTAEEAAELLTADNDPDGNDLESSSEDDLSSIGEDENQPILSSSDSDDTEAGLTSSESESEDDDELNDSIATNNYHKTRDDAVKWKRNIPSQRGRPSSINIVDANTIGPTQQVPQNFEYLLKRSIELCLMHVLTLLFSTPIKSTNNIVENIQEVQ